MNLTSVRYNTTDCYVYEDGSKSCVYPSKFIIENVIPHPEFNNKNLKNDIALLKLNRKVPKDEGNSYFIFNIHLYTANCVLCLNVLQISYNQNFKIEILIC